MNTSSNNQSSLSTPSDSLWESFGSGSQSAFTRIYDLYIDLLYEYGCHITADADLVKDCIHDLFVKMYIKRDNLVPVDNLKSYLLISLKNRIYDEMRRQANVFFVQSDEVSIVSNDDVENDYLKKEKDTIESVKVKSLMDVLSPRQREALTLYYMEDRKYDDICRIMEMNYQSVRNLIHRGMLKLRAAV
jgi:RNA polymerase sigma factor (sigma-70 family)